MFISSLFVHGKVIYLVNSTVLYHDSATITFILLHLKKTVHKFVIDLLYSPGLEHICFATPNVLGKRRCFAPHITQRVRVGRATKGGPAIMEPAVKTDAQK